MIPINNQLNHFMNTIAFHFLQSRKVSTREWCKHQALVSSPFGLSSHALPEDFVITTTFFFFSFYLLLLWLLQCKLFHTKYFWSKSLSSGHIHFWDEILLITGHSTIREPHQCGQVKMVLGTWSITWSETHYIPDLLTDSDMIFISWHYGDWDIYQFI